MTSNPCDLLLRELWIDEIFLKHIAPRGILVCLDTIALSRVCKWFSKELRVHVPACVYIEMHTYHFERSVRHYMKTNPTSTLEFLLDFKWPIPDMAQCLYIDVARECFERRAPDTFFAIARRTGYFWMPPLAYAQTADDMERFRTLSEGRGKQDHLLMTQLFDLIDRIQWTPSLLRWFVCFVEHHLDDNDYSPPIPYTAVAMYLRAIIDCRSSLEQCANYMNQIWKGWWDMTKLAHRHFRTKHSVAMALNMNCPRLVDYFIFDWPPVSPRSRQLPFSHSERLRILFGNTATEKLSEMVRAAPESQTWLCDIGFNITV